MSNSASAWYNALENFIFKINTWGYSTINFFAPMSRYASAGGGSINASREFKEMVKALHDAGIEVCHLLLNFCGRACSLQSMCVCCVL